MTTFLSSPPACFRLGPRMVITIVQLLSLFFLSAEACGQAISGLDQKAKDFADSMYRHARFQILVNQVGFTPSAAKFCLTADTSESPFTVVKRRTGEIVYQGVMETFEGDLGTYLVGNFSSLRASGDFEIVSGDKRSVEFRISDKIYDDALKKMVRYFSLQRCGPSQTGWHAPCHLDDGIRDDTGEHLEVTGGWHDASDLRKIPSTVFGLLGLTRLLDLLHPAWDHGQIIEELKWGNRYFLRMQDPEGFLMNGIDGSQNYWTDNMSDTDDDRTLVTRPA